jgi:hypothetical protein
MQNHMFSTCVNLVESGGQVNFVGFCDFKTADGRSALGRRVRVLIRERIARRLKKVAP